jgi:hypothetical protein
MNAEIYQIVKDAIEKHHLDCKCYICEAFTNAPDGSRGHAAACLAVANRMAEAQEKSDQALNRWSQ